MQIQLIQNIQPQFLIRELEQIKSAIQTSCQYLAILEERHETLISELKRITRPQPVIAEVSRRTTGPGFEYRGEMLRRWNYIDIHIDLFSRLWIEFPDRRETMALRRLVILEGRAHMDAGQTVSGKSLTWVQQHSRRLVDDWYMDTNLNPERMRRILQAPVKAAGLKWGEEVRVYWRTMSSP